MDIIGLISLFGSGGGGAQAVPLTATENGVYTAPEGEAYDPVTVAIPEAEGVEF